MAERNPSDMQENDKSGAQFSQEPIRLIYLDEETQKFKTNPAGLNIIRKLKHAGGKGEQQPGISIVSVNGV